MVDGSGYAEEIFWIRFYDECFDNYASVSNDLTDYTYSVNGGTYTFPTPFSWQETHSDCPRTQSCEIYNDSTDSWDACSVAFPYASSSSITSGGLGQNDGNLSYFLTSSGTAVWYINVVTAEWTGAGYTTPYEDLVYTVRISAVDPRSVNDAASIEDTFTLTIEYVCSLDKVTASGTNIGNTQVVIDMGSTVDLTIGYSQLYNSNSCPLVFYVEYWDSDTQEWESGSTGTPAFISSFSSSTGLLQMATTDYSTYDMYPWYNITMRLSVETTESTESSDTILYDSFDVIIVEKCRMVEIDTVMNVQQSASTSHSGSGTSSSPLKVNMWDYIRSPVTATTYVSGGSYQE